MKQQRDTKQRQLILDCVTEHHDHPTADDIYLDVRQRDSKISRGTVYRNLNVLSEDGSILHIKVPGADRFDSRKDNHYHIKCTECGRLIDISLPYEPQLDACAGAESGFLNISHQTFFEGVCPECNKKRGNKNE